MLDSKATSAARQPSESTPDHNDVISEARRVLRLEAEALTTMADMLDERFVHAADALGREAGGRVIVTGMGKSGHVARKIAATLASTGTPALFVHPAEASHGDLGMVTREDAVLALSNSGATAELASIVGYGVRLQIPIVAITAREPSPLADAASVTLVLPPVDEACPLQLAPTTSTTMMLAMGDALALALLARRGFSTEDFRALHPGGSLGSQLLRVSELMHRGEMMPLVDAGTPMAEALVAMTAKSFGCVGVVEDGGALAGIVTDGDLRRHMQDDLLKRTAGEVMTRSPKTIRPEAFAQEAIARMNDSGITSLFVVSENRPVGIVHLHDCLRAGLR